LVRKKKIKEQRKKRLKSRRIMPKDSENDREKP
jgi:hypothetical protein